MLLPLQAVGRWAAIAISESHAAGLSCDGQLHTWGSNNRGQLGLGDSETRGDGAGEMGSALPAVDLGPGRRPLALAAGSLHNCALLEVTGGAGGREVKCWVSGGVRQ